MKSIDNLNKEEIQKIIKTQKPVGTFDHIKNDVIVYKYTLHIDNLNIRAGFYLKIDIITDEYCFGSTIEVYKHLDSVNEEISFITIPR